MNETPSAFQRNIERWMYSIPALAILTLLMYFLVQSRPGMIGLMLFYLGPLLIAFLALVYLMTGIVQAIRKRPFFTWWRFGAWCILVLFLFTGSLYSKYPSSFDDKPSKVAFRLPLDTPIAVAWGGENEQVNYHVTAPDQCWAYDLMVIRNGSTHTGADSVLQNYYCYGLPVKAPAGGKVITAFDTDPDMPAGVLGGGTLPVGNHVVIEVAPSEFLFICHLQPHSLQVKAGDTVEAGQVIGLLGNSGNTSEPHVHIHLQSTSRQGFGEGIPMYFHHYTADGKYVDAGIPTGGFDAAGNFTGQTVQHADR